MGRFLSPADLSYDELGRAQPSGETPIVKQAALAAREFVCGLYETYPGGLLRTIGDTTTALSGHASLLDRMCRPIGKVPPAPVQQFVGGQCPGYTHYVRVNTTRLEVASNGSISQSVEQFGFDVVTPIFDVQLSGVVFLQAGQQRVKAAAGVVVYASAIGLDGKPFPYTYRFNKYTGSTVGGTGSLRDISVDPNPNDQMNCAAQPEKYKDDPIPLARITTNATLNLTPTVNVVAPITIIPTLIAPIYASIRPEINLDVGGLTVNFSGDGVRVTSPSTRVVQPNPTYDPREIPPSTINVDNSSEGSASCDLTPVLDKVKELKQEVEECCDRYHPFGDLLSSDYDVRVLGDGNSGTYNLPSKCYRVVVELVGDPILSDEYAGFSAPNVSQLGWCWFVAGALQISWGNFIAFSPRIYRFSRHYSTSGNKPAPAQLRDVWCTESRIFIAKDWVTHEFYDHSITL